MRAHKPDVAVVDVRMPPTHTDEGLRAAREREVLGLMAVGRTNAAIAAELVVTDRAVEKHVTGVFAKLDLAASGDDHRRVLAVLRFLDQPG